MHLDSLLQLGTWIGKRASLICPQPRGCGAGRVKKNNFDLKLSKSPEGQHDRSGQPLSSLIQKRDSLEGWVADLSLPP